MTLNRVAEKAELAREGGQVLILTTLSDDGPWPAPRLIREWGSMTGSPADTGLSSEKADST